MTPPRRPLIEMRLDGEIIPPRPRWPARLAAWAIVIAVLAGLAAVAALAFWLAAILLPVAILAGLVAWAALRFQAWRSGRGGRFRF
ncbi:MAG: hypothetical protein ACP5NP_07575 [Acetobacteraceae bacterium]